jgi:hypothetical protein
MNTQILKYLRIYSNYSQSFLAFKLNSDVTTINNIESNVIDGLDMDEYLIKYSKLFNMDLKGLTIFCYAEKGLIKHLVNFILWMLEQYPKEIVDN